MATMNYRLAARLAPPVPVDTRPRIAVVGAYVATGQHVVRQALEQGHRVTALVAEPARWVLAHDDLAVVHVDLHVGENLRWGWRGIPREDLAALMVRLATDASAVGKVLTVA